MTDTVAPPAPDPSPEVAERVLPRVEAAARRRRARRRAAVGLPVIAVVALLAAAAAAVASGGSDDEDVVAATDPAPTTSTAPPVDRLSIEPDKHWNMPTLSADGRTLEVSVSRSCGEDRYVHDLVETPDSVIVGVETVGDDRPLGPNEGCAAMISIDRIEVVLQEPLGDRSLYDGIGAEPRDDLLRRDRLIVVTHVPDRFGLERAHLDSPDEPWQQTFSDPEGRSFAVNQVPTALADEFYSGEDGTPITVAGRPAVLVPGPMGSMETIRFALGDLTVSVWTEAVEPPLDRAELVRIAEGLRLPEG